MLDVRLLQTFREVAVRGSFTDAAAALSYSQPAVSQQISRLERELGVTLLERGPRSLSVTPAGRVLLERTETVLQQMRVTVQDVRAAGAQTRTCLRVAAFPSAAATLLPFALRAVRDAHPLLQLELEVLEDYESLPLLAAGKLDVAVVLESDLQPVDAPPGVETVAVHDDEMLVALPADHRLASQPLVDLATLREEPWLLTELGGTCADTNIVLNACRAAGFEPNVRLESADYPALLGLAAAGLGVALIPTLAATHARSDVVIRRVRGNAPTRRILAAVPKATADSVSDAVVAALREAAQGFTGPAPRLTAVA